MTLTRPWRLCPILMCLLLSGCITFGRGCQGQSSTPIAEAKKAATEAAFFEDSVGKAKSLLPDTGETYWWVGALAGLCIAVGVFAIMASLFATALGIGTFIGGVRSAGFGCILLGVAMLALQHFLREYLRVVVFGSLGMAVVAGGIWLYPTFRWLVKRAIDKKTESIFQDGAALAIEEPRAGVAIMAAVKPEVNANRSEVLALIEQGKTASQAVKEVVGKVV